ncbi:MAG: HD domain-containing protein [Clostridia bacterium]|nr:HD domain-containing protein [Clostridia bacterium]
MASIPGDKVLRDPVHGLIRLPPEIVAVVDAPELQRLRRIAQLGMSPLTFHGAEHSRFGHALGAMYLFGEVAEQLERVGLPLPPESRLVGALAALLHDVGHGPLSHALEAESTGGLGHEAWGRRILLGETEIHRRLEALDRRLPERIAAVLEGREQPLLHHLISSQLDVDRMDYLIRDSLFTGASAGHFDAGQLIHVLGGVHQAHPVVRNKGLWTVEEYVFARYYMYQQVYHHKTTRGAERLLQAAAARARRAYAEGRLEARGPLPALLLGEAGVAEYLEVDDAELWVALKHWREADDPVLADLSRRLLERRLLKPVYRRSFRGLDEEALRRAHELAAREVRSAGYDPDAYLHLDRRGRPGYAPYRGAGAGGAPIWVEDERGRPVPLEELSPAVAALTVPREAVVWYAPEELRGRLAPLLERAMAGAEG